MALSRREKAFIVASLKLEAKNRKKEELQQKRDAKRKKAARGRK